MWHDVSISKGREQAASTLSFRLALLSSFTSDAPIDPVTPAEYQFLTARIRASSSVADQES